MIAMQYAIDLPSDYDMEIVRRRVRVNGNRTDDFPGLAMKAYLIAEKDKYGNTRNQYAPFYVWNTVEGMNDFLLRGPFNNILQSFGSPRVMTWFVVHAVLRKDANPGVACVDRRRLHPYSDFDSLTRADAEANEKLPDAASFVAAYNPHSWEKCRMWLLPSEKNIKNKSDSSLIYDIHHIS